MAKSKKTVPFPGYITDDKGKKVKLNWNHDHPVCPACNGRSAGTNIHCGTCKGHGTVAPSTWPKGVPYSPDSVAKPGEEVAETAPEVAETTEGKE